MISLSQGAMESHGSLLGSMPSVEQGGLTEASMASLWESLVLLLSGQAADWSRTLSTLCWTLQSVFIGALKRQYLQNDYFAGGVGLMVLGLIGAYLKRYGGMALTYLTKKRGVTCVHIKPEETAFQVCGTLMQGGVICCKLEVPLIFYSQWTHYDGTTRNVGISNRVWRT
eukprot:TRINITY_DN736_c0_g1_i2.p1 TRINITY_DN736_c0_g1~~TRINITY_DN736_c0_g1_i2.p1  ORF type:complete len:170 (-),score=15.77 TRINITY_DN736_c0_g1_i2:54-563(-)